LAAALTWSQALNGVAALWVESALVFLPVYAAGCVSGAILKGGTEPEPSIVTAARLDTAATEPQPPKQVAPSADDSGTVIVTKPKRSRPVRKKPEKT
jgi:hypothetical protein